MDSSYCDLELRKIINLSMRSDIPRTYGIIVWCKRTSRWLMIRRKHSVHYLSFLRGRYPISFTTEIISHLTEDEFESVKQIVANGYDYYIQVMNDVYGDMLKGNKLHLVSWNHISYSLDLVIRSIAKFESSTKPPLQYLWAKGHPNTNNEKGLETAIRELKEEAEIDSLPESAIILDSTVEYSRNGIFGVYNVTCWICVVEEEFNLKNVSPKDNEVSDRRWMLMSECKPVMNNIEYSVLEGIPAQFLAYYTPYTPYTPPGPTTLALPVGAVDDGVVDDGVVDDGVVDDEGD